MKKHYLIMCLAMLALAVFSCKKTDPDPIPTPEPDPDPVETTYCERKGNGKDIYVPNEFKKNGAFNQTTNNYCYKRSYETENIIVMWESKFGDDPLKAPAKESKEMTFDPKAIADQAEVFYSMYKNDLKFIQAGSKADKYKMMVMVTYTTNGTVYGGSYDGVIGALWLEPSRIEKNGRRQNALAHELGHSFQMQLGIDTDSGFGSGGIYEMTSQWMLWQTNPNWYDDEKYHWDSYMDQTHLAFMHPDNMYHTAEVLEYWSFLHGQTFVADLWRAAQKKNDVVAVYKKLAGVDQEQFNDEMYDRAARMMTYDIPRIHEACAKLANKHKSTLGSADADGWRAITSKRAPQPYGYNGIKLAALKSGQKITLEFKGNSSDANAAWRFGLVGVKSDGTAVYSEMGKASGSEDVASISFEADSDYSYLWLVVTAAPGSHRYYSEEYAGNYKSYPYLVRTTVE